MANPVYVTLVADTEATPTLDANYAYVEVALVSGAATTYFNTSDTPITTVAGGPVAGNHVLTTTLPAKLVPDMTGGQASKVRLRSTGAPTVQLWGV